MFSRDCFFPQFLYFAETTGICRLFWKASANIWVAIGEVRLSGALIQGLDSNWSLGGLLWGYQAPSLSLKHDYDVITVKSPAMPYALWLYPTNTISANPLQLEDVRNCRRSISLRAIRTADSTDRCSLKPLSRIWQPQTILQLGLSFILQASASAIVKCAFVADCSGWILFLWNRLI